MLTNKKISIVADSILNEERIATFGAVLNIDNLELSMTGRYINKEACKDYRDIVRADQADFEDYAYSIQDSLYNIKETTDISDEIENGAAE